jgi:rhamnosyltransferase subunit B
VVRILLAWELGGNGGHAAKLASLARTLHAEGHHVSIAAQRPDAFRAMRDLLPAIDLRQAPLWPGLLNHARDLPRLRHHQSFGDILADAGLSDSGVLEFLLRAWQGLFSDLAPDLLVAEFAPAALLAARGKIPRVALGTGFSLPPAHLPAFPPFTEGQRPVLEEAALLNVANHALARLGQALLPHLPAIMAAEAACPATFAALDPYGPHRKVPPLPPFLPAKPTPAKHRDSLFVYLPAQSAQIAPILKALLTAAARGHRIFGHLPGLPTAELNRLTAAGLHLNPTPLPLDAITEHARLILAQGGLGLTSTALAAGIPLLLLPTDREKRLTAEACERLGVARVCAPEVDPAPLLAEMLENHTAESNAKAKAAKFLNEYNAGTLPLLLNAIHGLL